MGLGVAVLVGDEVAVGGWEVKVGEVADGMLVGAGVAVVLCTPGGVRAGDLVVLHAVTKRMMLRKKATVRKRFLCIDASQMRVFGNHPMNTQRAYKLMAMHARQRLAAI
jgi:hypothetical protein